MGTERSYTTSLARGHHGTCATARSQRHGPIDGSGGVAVPWAQLTPPRPLSRPWRHQRASQSGDELPGPSRNIGSSPFDAACQIALRKGNIVVMNRHRCLLPHPPWLGESKGPTRRWERLPRDSGSYRQAVGYPGPDGKRLIAVCAWVTLLITQ